MNANACHVKGLYKAAPRRTRKNWRPRWPRAALKASYLAIRQAISRRWSSAPARRSSPPDIIGGSQPESINVSKQKLLRSFTIQPSVPFTYATTSTIFKFPLRVSLGSARGIFQACRILLKTKSARPAARRATISHGVRDPSMTNEKKDKPAEGKTNSGDSARLGPPGTIRRRLPSQPHTSPRIILPCSGVPVRSLCVWCTRHGHRGIHPQQPIPRVGGYPLHCRCPAAVAGGDLATSENARRLSPPRHLLSPPSPLISQAARSDERSGEALNSVRILRSVAPI
jgi:hypothetical protein